MTRSKIILMLVVAVIVIDVLQKIRGRVGKSKK